MTHGGIQIGYYAGAGATSPSGGKTAYFDNSQGTAADHSVLIIGWDDNFSRENFNSDASKCPSIDGAWLVKNSWGDSWPILRDGDGCFWMSYEQYIQSATVYIVEANDPYLKHYGHDALGRSGACEYIWAANVFKAERDNELIKSVAFYTTDNNANYELYIYDLGTTAQASPVPSDVSTAVYKSAGSETYAGYHTKTLEDTVAIEKDHYFSVVTSIQNPSYKFVTAVELATNYTSPVINAGESYFASGTAGTIPSASSWFDAYYSEDEKENACIKVFTTLAEDPGFEISSDVFPDDNFRAYILTASVDKNQNGCLSESEIAAVISLDISGRNIASLKGIEKFTSLAELNCANNSLASLDVSSLTLTAFNADGQNITGLKARASADTFYYVDITSCVSLDISAVSADSFDKASGVFTFTSLPESVSYSYNTNFSGAGQYMTVTAFSCGKTCNSYRLSSFSRGKQRLFTSA